MGRAGRPPGCYNCGCPDSRTIVLNCLGCDRDRVSLPSMWQIDFPTILQYSVPTSNSCSSEEYGLGTLNGFGGRHKNTLYHLYEYPDISDFGVSTILEIDQAAPISESLPISECIWATNTLSMYEVATRGGVDQLSIGILNCGDYGPSIIRGQFLTQDPWWHKRPTYAYDIFGGFSPYRDREIIYTTNPLCYVNNCNWVASVYSCSVNSFGIAGTLSISDGKFILRIVWAPYRETIMERWDNDSMTNETRWRRRLSNVSAGNSSIPHLSTGICATSLYPRSIDVHANDANYGGGIYYEKEIDCETDFNGSPILLLKTGEISMNGASQPVMRANGITGIPSYVTITPL